MKQAITLFLSACVLLASAPLPGARAEGVITLKSGEKLPGIMEAMNRPYMKIRSSILSNPVDINMDELDEVAFSHPLEIPEQFSVLKLSNGDEFYGTLKALDTESLQLQTAWGGLLPVNRKYVRHIGFDSQKAYLRNATESLQGWECTTSNVLPECRNGYWIMNDYSGSTTLRTSFSMPSRLHVQLSLYHVNTFHLNLSLWENSNPNCSIKLQISPDKMELTKFCSGRRQSLGWIKRNIKQDRSYKNVSRSDVDFYADREKGNYCLYINGKQVGRWKEGKDMDAIFDRDGWNDDEEDKEAARKFEFKPGNTFAVLCSGYNSHMAIFNLNVFDWNGSLPSPEEEQDVVSRYDTDSPRDKALLVNGDVLRGDITLQENGSIRIKSDHYDVAIPTARVRSLDQKGMKKNSLRDESSDTRVFLTDQSILSLTLGSIRSGFMEGHSAALGKVRIPLQSIRKVQFNLKHPDLRKQRETPFLAK